MHLDDGIAMNGASPPGEDIEVSRLKEDPRIRNLYQNFPQHASSLDTCCKILCQKFKKENIERLAQGVMKAHRAMAEQYRVFISYRRLDHGTIATKLSWVLDGLGAGQVNSFLDNSSLA